MRQQIRFLRGASVAAFGTVLLAAAPAWAAGSNMPWEQPLNQILQSVEGPVAKIIAVIIIVVTGLTLAFGPEIIGLSMDYGIHSAFLDPKSAKTWRANWPERSAMRTAP